LNFKEFISSVAQSEGIPAGKVRKVSLALLGHMSSAIDDGEKLQLPGLSFNPRTQAAKDAESGGSARPERKIAVLRRRKGKGKGKK
tara:strand:- start:585 stop:842 length:258 start_codon:yes stop_codon:yes gene_type:complete